MNTLFNSWISIGKRQALPPLDIQLETKPKSQGFNPSLRQQRRELLNRKKEKPISPPKIEEVIPPRDDPFLKPLPPKPRSPPVKSPSPPQFVERPIITPQMLPIHAKVVPIKEIIQEICLYDQIKVKKYNSLDERQKSLLNKIMTYKFQPDILDVIDTGGVKVITTEEYLLDNPSQNAERTLLYLRLKLLFETKFNRSKLSTSSFNQQGVPISTLAHQYFGQVFELQPLGDQDTKVNAVVQEIGWLRMMAAFKLKDSKGIDWLMAMRNLIHDIIYIPQDLVIENYKADLDKRLTRFFYDEDNDSSSFFPKLKTKMKERKVTLPLTVQELKNWDHIVVKTLKTEMNMIGNHIAKEKDRKPQQENGENEAKRRDAGPDDSKQIPLGSKEKNRPV